jgi:signal transduction histidine kinase
LGGIALHLPSLVVASSPNACRAEDALVDFFGEPVNNEIEWDFASPDEVESSSATLAAELTAYCRRFDVMTTIPGGTEKALVDAILNAINANFVACILVSKQNNSVSSYAARGCLALSQDRFPVAGLRQLLGIEPDDGPVTPPSRWILNAEQMDGLVFMGEPNRFEQAFVSTVPIWEQESIAILFVGFKKEREETTNTIEFLDAMLNVASLAMQKAVSGQCIKSEHERVVRAKQEWQSSVDVLNQMICLVDASGNVVRANRAVEQFGLGKVTDIRGQFIWNLLTRLDVATAQRERASVSEWCSQLRKNWTTHWQTAVDCGGVEWVLSSCVGENLYCVALNLVNMSTPYSKGVEPHAVVVVDDLSRSLTYRNRVHDDSGTTTEPIEGQFEESTTPGWPQLLSDELLDAQEEERSRVAMELHDGIGQMLTMMKLQCDCVIEELNNSHLLCDPVSRVRGLRESLANSIEEVRRVSRNLRPPMLDDLGIGPTLRWFFRECEKANPELELSVTIDIDEEKLYPDLETEIFRITQEAINNIAKHAGASKAQYGLTVRGSEVLLVIEDNGVGFDATELQAEGSGFRNMRTRVVRSGGHFAVESSPNAGVKIAADWLF